MLEAGKPDPSEPFLHDGRARDLSEAILWHGGEATDAQRAFLAMTAGERAELLVFLESL